ncbi:hypothetical protein LWI28_022201 [Acer negundo]|uniref:Uncharacterized protein n=1 Tax=Acer negundo TaxID=4023 RepID=A0AAD5J0P2_ACENE|nr:hypothetical protein LWI28_022201 [Acer negundo]
MILWNLCMKKECRNRGTDGGRNVGNGRRVGTCKEGGGSTSLAMESSCDVRYNTTPRRLLLDPTLNGVGANIQRTRQSTVTDSYSPKPIKPWFLVTDPFVTCSVSSGSCCPRRHCHSLSVSPPSHRRLMLLTIPARCRTDTFSYVRRVARWVPGSGRFAREGRCRGSETEGLRIVVTGGAGFVGSHLGTD